MSLRTTLHATLQASPAVCALIGEGGAIRHYPVRAPQGTARPYLVSQVIIGQAEETHGNPDDAEDVLDETLVQFTAIADDVDVADALIRAVRQAFIDPTLAECRALLDAAHITAAGPQVREGVSDEVDAGAPQLDLTFFHNPNT